MTRALDSAEENPSGDAAARCDVYRRQIDDLLSAVKRAAQAIHCPADLWEIRKHLRETHGLGADSESSAQ